jgi:hypothetical protein
VPRAAGETDRADEEEWQDEAEVERVDGAGRHRKFGDGGRQRPPRDRARDVRQPERAEERGHEREEPGRHPSRQSMAGARSLCSGSWTLPGEVILDATSSAVSGTT